MDAYQEAVAFTLLREGGYYDGSDPRDPNPTNYGVTQTTYDEYRTKKDLPTRSVKDIEHQEVQDIYRGYWIPGLPTVTSITVFDHSINAGPENAIKVLQRALGFMGDDVDGVIGPVTRASLAEFLKDFSDETLADMVCWERERYYVNVAEQSVRQRPNLLSWILRVVKFREHYLKQKDGK